MVYQHFGKVQSQVQFLLRAPGKYCMIFLPAFCVDDFYSDPDAVREFALKQTFLPSDGRWPGKKTRDLSEIDPKFYDLFCKKVFSIFFEDLNKITRYKLITSFQLVPCLNEDPLSPKNQGWIHIDDQTIFAGVIYLSPDSNLENGTSMFKLVNEKTLDHYSTCKQDFYTGKISQDYDETILRHNGSYVETIRFNNIYNRMICFDRSQPHGVRSFYSTGEERLTQVFFLLDFETTVDPPIQRHKRFL